MAFAAAHALASAGPGALDGVSGASPQLAPPGSADDTPTDPAPAVVRAALDRALADRAALGATQLFLECVRDAALPAVELFGRGIGIWDGRRQFDLAPERMSAVVAALRSGGFAELAPSYGGRPKSDEPGKIDPNAARKVLCRIRFELEETTKEVVQLDEGEQSPVLRSLADALYALVSEPASRGFEIESLEDGLTRLAAGTVAPEAFSLTLHRKPELLAVGGRPGFLLRIEGRSASVRPFDADAGHGTERRLELAPSELSDLASALARLRPSRLPVNLWAGDYNDFSIELLGRAVSVQARAFSGMSAATHGELQRDFDAAAALLTRLEERIVERGQPRDES